MTTAISARIFSLLVLVLAIAPMVAPTLGGWIAMAFGWQGVFLALAAFGAIVGLSVFFRLEESRSPETAAKAAHELVLHAYWGLLRHRRLLGYILVAACNGAVLFSYIASSPDLLIEVWGFDQTEFGLIFALLASGVIGSSQVNRALLRRRSPDQILSIACLIAVLAGVVLVAHGSRRTAEMVDHRRLLRGAGVERFHRRQCAGRRAERRSLARRHHLGPVRRGQLCLGRHRLGRHLGLP